MREKLLDLMKSEGLKPSQLAEILGINPAAISHILAGRNKPGFDLLQKILRRFPRINPDWLILDSETMYRNTESDVSANPTNPIVNSSLFDIQESSAPEKTENIRMTVSTQSATSSDLPAAISTKSDSSEIERIVVFYTDRTFESFYPKK